MRSVQHPDRRGQRIEDSFEFFSSSNNFELFNGRNYGVSRLIASQGLDSPNSSDQDDRIGLSVLEPVDVRRVGE